MFMTDKFFVIGKAKARIVIVVSLVVIFCSNIVYASGGYDYGTPTGLNQLQLDFTWNPFDVIEYGQSYLVWGYGITDYLDFHGFVSHSADNCNQIYGGFMLCFFKSETLDLSTAVGYRFIDKYVDFDIPQLLYNYKFWDGYSIGGSIVSINRDGKKNIGTAYDIAFFIPVGNYLELPSWVRSLHFGVGLFRPVTNAVYPTYSVDVKLVSLDQLFSK